MLVNGDRCIKSEVCCGIGLSAIHQQRHRSISRSQNNNDQTNAAAHHIPQLPKTHHSNTFTATVSLLPAIPFSHLQITNSSQKPQTQPKTMCKYYAHTHPCGHTKTVFAAFCPSAALVQRACAGGEIWATVKMEADCAACGAEKGEGGEYRGVAMVGGAGRRNVRSGAGGKKARR